jgi:hypothetical protein
VKVLIYLLSSFSFLSFTKVIAWSRVIEQNKLSHFTYGPKRHTFAVIIFQLYSHISRGSSRDFKAASSVIVSIVYHVGIAANFLSSSSEDHTWIIGPYLHILAMIGFQLLGSVHIALSEFTLSIHSVVSIRGWKLS